MTTLCELEAAFARASVGPTVDRHRLRGVIEGCLAIMSDPATDPGDAMRAVELNRRAFKLYLKKGGAILN